MKSNVGDIHQWKDGDKHLKTENGWVTLVDQKKRDLKEKIYSSKYLDDVYFNDTQKEVKSKIQSKGFSNFDYYSVKKEFDSIVGKKGTMNIYFDNDHKIACDYENGKIKFQTYFFLDKDDNLDVEHFYLDMPQKMQNKGFAKKIMQTYYAQYVHSGINKIIITANMEIGGYAWAKYGFSCTKNQIHELLQKDPDISRSEFQDIVDKFYELNNDHTPFPMRLIANYTDEKGNAIGKDALFGSKWEGFLDLHNDKQRIIFEQYLGNDKKTISEVSKKLDLIPKDSIKTDEVFKTTLKSSDHPTIHTLKDVYSDLIIKKGFKEEEFFVDKKVQDVDVFHVHPTAEDLEIKKLKEVLDGSDDYPFAIKIGEEFYVIKGHHQIAGDILKNNSKVKMKVYEYKEK